MPASISDTLKISPEPRISRPTRVAILLGEGISGNYLEEIFSGLNCVSIIPSSNLEEVQTLADYDVVGLLGEPAEFTFLRRLKSFGRSSDQDSNTITLAFAPKRNFPYAKNYLKVAGGVVFCKTSSKQEWLREISDVMFHFFESLVLPSLLNIDLADVRRIAKGIGLAFNESDDSAEKIISRLPEACLVARSALLHFSCREEVKLKEIYSISKAIAQRKQDEEPEVKLLEWEEEIKTHEDALRLIRKLNVKMGIRIREGKISTRTGAEHFPSRPETRISMTAILFGL